MNQNLKTFLLHMCSSNDVALRHYQIPSNDYITEAGISKGIKIAPLHFFIVCKGQQSMRRVINFT